MGAITAKALVAMLFGAALSGCTHLILEYGPSKIWERSAESCVRQYPQLHGYARPAKLSQADADALRGVMSYCAVAAIGKADFGFEWGKPLGGEGGDLEHGVFVYEGEGCLLFSLQPARGGLSKTRTVSGFASFDDGSCQKVILALTPELREGGASKVYEMHAREGLRVSDAKRRILDRYPHIEAH